ncbi:MAG TPA: hypothetical protein VJT49_15320 [Amycolatopsis sp.]|uniref:hypothetical protein n=1 Tax=Amycolatopsis sp. TaxID=37632 RepID=UPI002B49A2F8|nr:hypothetical protein [Amycolatopsis sp.]HKS46449.1 hypothetical protein [Amycolatopsis sp.]
MNRIELAASAATNATTVAPLATGGQAMPVLCTPAAVKIVAAAFGVGYLAAKAFGPVDEPDFEAPDGEHGLAAMSVGELIGFRRGLSGH